MTFLAQWRGPSAGVSGFAVFAAVVLALAGSALAGQAAHAQEPPRVRSVVVKPSAVPAPRVRPAVPLLAAGARRDTTQADRWVAMDKAKHFGGSMLLVLGGQYVLEEKATLDRDPALALSLAGGAAVGLAKELYDWRIGPTRYFSVRDLVADALGLLLGAGVVLL